MIENNIHIFLANYGSGKTEFALNYALKLKKKDNKNVALADLDTVNLYYRSRDVRELFANAGIEIISSVKGYEKADTPSISPSIMGYIQNKDYHTVLDVGGDPVGATVLGSLSSEIKKQNYEAFFVININRPFTRNADEILELYKMLEQKSRIKITGLINNTNLQEHSTIDNIKKGEEIVQKVSETINVPVVYTGVYEDIWNDVDTSLKYEKFKIRRFMRKPWEKLPELPQ
jgi:hypothetical protein